MQFLSIIISIIALVVAVASLRVNRAMTAELRRVVGHLARLTEEESGRGD
jgi:hypothetical protein